MLSVWILGTGLRAHVEPFEDRGNDDALLLGAIVLIGMKYEL